MPRQNLVQSLSFAFLLVLGGCAGAVAGADSPVFASLIGQTTLDLFPTRNEHDDDDDRGGNQH